MVAHGWSYRLMDIVPHGENVTALLQVITLIGYVVSGLKV